MLLIGAPSSRGDLRRRSGPHRLQGSPGGRQIGISA